MNLEAKSAQIHLVGVRHAFEEGDVGEGNYRQVKDYLEMVKPTFVTLEVKLYTGHLHYLGAEKLLVATSEELDQRESNLLSSPEYAEEYDAAIIYCRRNNIPLYFIDLYDIPPEQLAQTNMINVKDPLAICTPDSVQVSDYVVRNRDNFNERNRFIGKTIDLIAQQYPGGQGVHVGGADHVRRGHRKVVTLLDTVHAPIAEVRRLRLKPRSGST